MSTHRHPYAPGTIERHPNTAQRQALRRWIQVTAWLVAACGLVTLCALWAGG